MLEKIHAQCERERLPEANRPLYGSTKSDNPLISTIKLSSRSLIEALGT